MRQRPLSESESLHINRVVKELRQDADGLRRQAEAAAITGGETYVRVKDPTLLLSTMIDAADMLDDLRAWYSERGV